MKPTVEEMAELLVHALPEPDREAARKLLVSQILPARLANSDVPIRQYQRVCKSIARALSACEASSRLEKLQLIAQNPELPEAREPGNSGGHPSLKELGELAEYLFGSVQTNEPIDEKLSEVREHLSRCKRCTEEFGKLFNRMVICGRLT